MPYRVFVINTGSTSTKCALFEDENCLVKESITTDPELVRNALKSIEQLPQRRKDVQSFIERNGIDLNTVDIISARGGPLANCEGGAYYVNQKMVDVLKYQPISQHASNLSSMLARELGLKYSKPAIIYDSVSTDEMDPIAKISGLPEVPINTGCHVLNPRAVGRYVAEKKLGKAYKDSRLIVCHMGGGITICAQRDGKLVDYVTDYTGPMSPERSGALPSGTFARLCFSGKYTADEVYKLVSGRGGLFAHLGTADALEVEKRAIAGEEPYKLIYDAMCYQISKRIGELAPVFKGDFDAIVFTGSLAKSDYIINYVKDRVGFLAPIIVVPGEMEMEALAGGALRVLRGEEEAKEYDILPKGISSWEEFYAKYEGK
ncbi:MAG: butyrate kinase [Oscillospiraceae bacterium]|jgi:butyrate kinase